jgi:hypothetical protein
MNTGEIAAAKVAAMVPPLVRSAGGPPEGGHYVRS